MTTPPGPVPVPSETPRTVPAALRLANRLAMGAAMATGKDAEILFREAGRALALAWVLSRSEPCAENVH